MRRALQNLAFGGALLPQEFTLGLDDPQTEIAVWLEGPGFSLDVTHRYSVACAAPLTFCVGFDEDQGPRKFDGLSLKFRERGGPHRVLGEIGLWYRDSFSLPRAQFTLFGPRSSTNYCIARRHLAAHYLVFAYRQWKKDNTKGVRMSFLERRAIMVDFIRPHPVMLVSLGDTQNGNIFPMNLLGELGNGYFGLALRAERLAGGLVERSGRVALSTMPLSRGAVAYQLAHNHSKASFDWSTLPFPTRPSTKFAIPVPAFALQVREMEIQSVRGIGSHSLYAGRIVQQETWSEGPAFGSIHGFYQSWRLKKCDEAELESSLAVDALSKRGRYEPLAK